MPRRGQISGHPRAGPLAGGHTSGHGSAGGYPWDRYLADLVDEHGSLAKVAEILASERRHREDVASIERALRRLRSRGTLPGGTWGVRLVRHFGVPRPVERRLAWMGTYHSRFTDLPVAVCLELIAPWERGPVVEDAAGRAWLALARVSLAMRTTDLDGAAAALERARADEGADVAVQVERRLGTAWIASRRDKDAVEAILADVGPRIADVADDVDRACFFARWIDHRAYRLHHLPSPDHAETEALYRQIPEDGPPFALARRANGLAWTLWKQGRTEEAASSARAAATHAGDGGHVRLRAMALAMLARITGDADAARRNRDIVAALDDEILRRRGSGLR